MMTETMPMPVPAPTKKSMPKKKSMSGTKKPKTMANHPTYMAMVCACLKTMKKRGGCSKPMIFKYIMQNYKLGEDAKMINSHLRMCLKRGVTSGMLKQVKGTGASGSFRMGETKPAMKKKPMKKTTKTTKPKKTMKKKMTPATKKMSPKKMSPKKTKTPKKAMATKKKMIKKTKTPKKMATPMKQ